MKKHTKKKFDGRHQGKNEVKNAKGTSNAGSATDQAANETEKSNGRKTSKRDKNSPGADGPKASEISGGLFQQDLIEVRGVKKLAEEMAGAAYFAEILQLPFHKVDDQFLRRLSNSENINPRTGKPWVPAPVKGKWPVVLTLCGVCEWIDSNADSVKRLPRVCDSMTHAEQLYHVPAEQMTFVRDHGGADAFVGGSRVDVIKVLEHCFDRHKKIYSGGAANVKGLEDMPELDESIMRARVLKQTEIEKIRENNLAEKILRTADDFEDEVADPLAALAAGLNNYPRQTGTKLKNLLATLGVAEADAARVVDVAVSGVNDARHKLTQAMENATKMRQHAEEQLAKK